MKEKLKNSYYICREICLGSGRITILSVLIITIILYIFYFMYENSAILPLLTGNLNKNNFLSTEHYLEYIESLRLNLELTLLIPVLSTIILLIKPSNQLKTNTLNRLLPITLFERVVSFMIIIFVSTLFSYGIVIVLDYVILYFIRSQYLHEVLSLQESIGELYKKKVMNGYLFSLESSFNFIAYIKRLPACIILSMVFNTIVLVINFLFEKYSIIKGVVLIFMVLFVAMYLRRINISYHSSTVNTHFNAYPIVYYIYFPLIFICALFAFYYLLKQKER